MTRMDELAADFGSEQDTFPGSRREIPRTPAQEKAVRRTPGADAWDLHPQMWTMPGQGMAEFFTIGDLAKALGRKAGTIRKWEANGVIPPARYKTPAKDARGQRRLYSRAQIEGIVRIAVDEKILDLGERRPAPRKEFTRRCFELFAELAAQ